MKPTCALLLAAGLLCARPAHANGFTAFAEDEDACRHAGTAAIGQAAGPIAARRYDNAYGACMAAHVNRRQMDAYRQGGLGEPPGNPHSFEFPDAYYSVPYATPGYGYDGFSY